MTITIERNQKIQILQIICVCVCERLSQIQMLKLPKYQKRYIIKE